VLAVAKVSKSGGQSTGLKKQLTKIFDGDGNVVSLEESMPAGASIVGLAEGESLDLKTSQRPAMAVIDGVKAFCHFLAMSSDLPVSVLLSFAGVGGTAVRADLEDAQNNFDQRQDQVIWRHSQRIYVRRLALAQERGEIARCKDPFWWRSKWQGPRKLTVDYGRTAAATIALFKAGALSHQKYYEELGLDPDAEMRSQIDYLAAAQAYCDEQGVPFERFIEGTPGAGNSSAPTDPTAQPPD
jgi:capsid protein